MASRDRKDVDRKASCFENKGKSGKIQMRSVRFLSIVPEKTKNGSCHSGGGTGRSNNLLLLSSWLITSNDRVDPARLSDSFRLHTDVSYLNMNMKLYLATAHF